MSEFELIANLVALDCIKKLYKIKRLFTLQQPACYRSVPLKTSGPEKINT